MKWQDLMSLSFSPGDGLSLGVKPRRKILITKPDNVQDGGRYRRRGHVPQSLSLKQNISCRVLHRVPYSGDAGEVWPPLKWNCTSDEILKDYIITESLVECECHMLCLKDEILIPSCHLTLRIDDPPFVWPLTGLQTYLLFMVSGGVYGLWGRFGLRHGNRLKQHKKIKEHEDKNKEPELKVHEWIPPSRSGIELHQIQTQGKESSAKEVTPIPESLHAGHKFPNIKIILIEEDRNDGKGKAEDKLSDVDQVFSSIQTETPSSFPIDFKWDNIRVVPVLTSHDLPESVGCEPLFLLHAEISSPGKSNPKSV